MFSMEPPEESVNCECQPCKSCNGEGSGINYCDFRTPTSVMCLGRCSGHEWKCERCKGTGNDCEDCAVHGRDEVEVLAEELANCPAFLREMGVK